MQPNEAANDPATGGGGARPSAAAGMALSAVPKPVFNSLIRSTAVAASRLMANTLFKDGGK